MLSYFSLKREPLFIACILKTLAFNISLLELQLHLTSTQGDILFLNIKTFFSTISVLLFIIGLANLFKDTILNREFIIQGYKLIVFSIVFTIIVQLFFFFKLVM